MGCALILYHGSIKERGFSRRAERQRMQRREKPQEREYLPLWK